MVALAIALPEEDTDVLAEQSPVLTLLDGAGGAITLAAATGAWRLMRNRQEGKKSRRTAESEEVKALRAIVDNLLLFMVGRQGEDGLPDIEGFIGRFGTFETEMRGAVASLTGSVTQLTELVHTVTGGKAQ